ncbi:MAG TPA: DMT family transporter [Rugosimonospora sp.]|jgi:drug/metabolite transporter (DMT)-like permease
MLPTIVALTVAVLAVSSSAPLIAYAAAPALAIAFWRNAAATVLLAPLVGTTRRREVAKLGWRGAGACALAGVALAGHFGTWVPSAKLTTIAAATALVATQPVWQGLIALTQGRRLPRVVWVGIAVAVAGAVVATGSDFTTSGRAFAGDLLALAGGLMAAVYTAFGERARATTSTTTYTAICYGACSLVLLVVCLAGGVRLHAYPAATWLAILAMTAGPQLLGHSMFNYALHRVAATTVSVLLLLEVPGAALLGWLWLGQAPRADELPGLGLLVVGVAIVVLGARSLVRLPPNPPDGA